MTYATCNNGTYKSVIVSVTATGSPMVWQNPEANTVRLFLSGGTLNALEYSPDGITWASMGIGGGILLLNPGEYTRITYVLAPTMNYTAF